MLAVGNTGTVVLAVGNTGTVALAVGETVEMPIRTINYLCFHLSNLTI